MSIVKQSIATSLQKRKKEDESGDETDRKRAHKGEDDEAEASENVRILEMLKAQNSLLQSIDARLECMVWQRQDYTARLLSQKNQGSDVVNAGQWKFLVENQSWLSTLVEPISSTYHYRVPSTKEAPKEPPSYGRTNNEGLVLAGDTFPKNHPPSYSSSTVNLSLPDEYMPNWTGIIISSNSKNDKIRSSLPQLVFSDKARLVRDSGVYELSISYNSSGQNQTLNDAGIVIGEIEFNNQGYVMAEGADWDRLLVGQRQTQLPYAHGARGEPKWLRRKISEPWQDGDELKFRIDTNENTIVFEKSNSSRKVFWNVLAFTNNRKYPDFLRVMAFCGTGRTLSLIQ